jgi:WD40 repeat protein
MSNITNFLNPYTQTTLICSLLPLDMLDNIWLRLNIQDILKCTQACTQWYQKLVVVDKSDHGSWIWKKIFTQHFPHQSHEEVKDFQQAYKDAYIYPQNLSHGIYASSEIVPSLQGHTALATAGKMLLIGSASGKTEIKHFAPDQTIFLPKTQNQQITSFAFANNGVLLVGYRQGPIELWTLNPHQCIHTLDTQNRKVYSVACANAKVLFFSHGSGFIEVWDIEPLKFKQMIIQPSEGAYVLAATNKWLFAGSSKGEIKIFSLENFNLIDTLQTNLTWVTALTVDGDEKLFAAGPKGEIEIWNIDTSERIASLTLDRSATIASLGCFDGNLFVGYTTSLFTPFSNITKINFKADRANVLEEIASQLELENDDPNSTHHYAEERLSRMLKLKQYEQLNASCNSCSSTSKEDSYSSTSKKLADAIRDYLYFPSGKS